MILFSIFATIVILFVSLLGLKKHLPFKLCAICVSISLTWVSLLVLYRLSVFNDPVILALLMGGSVVGIYYAVEKRVPTELTVFRLPFLLSSLLIAYMIITLIINLPAISLIATVWIVMIFAYAYRNKAGVNQIVKNVIQCCAKW